MMLHYYRMNPDKSTERLSAEDWVLAFSGDRRVASEQIGDARVSTVFLGLDHSHGYGPPLLFETMIFGGEHDQHQERCSTYEQALEMHRKAVEKVKAA